MNMKNDDCVNTCVHHPKRDNEIANRDRKSRRDNYCYETVFIIRD